MDFSQIWRYIPDGALASLKFLLPLGWTFPLCWLIGPFIPPLFFHLYFFTLSSVFRTFSHSSQGQRGCPGVCFFFSPFFLYSPKKAKAGYCSWVWNQSPGFAFGVAQDGIFNYLPHIYFVSFQQCIEEDCFVPSHCVEVL